eukprot:143742_1
MMYAYYVFVYCLLSTGSDLSATRLVATVVTMGGHAAGALDWGGLAVRGVGAARDRGGGPAFPRGQLLRGGGHLDGDLLLGNLAEGTGGQGRGLGGSAEGLGLVPVVGRHAGLVAGTHRLDGDGVVGHLVVPGAEVDTLQVPGGGLGLGDEDTVGGHAEALVPRHQALVALGTVHEDAAAVLGIEVALVQGDTREVGEEAQGEEVLLVVLGLVQELTQVASVAGGVDADVIRLGLLLMPVEGKAQGLHGLQGAGQAQDGSEEGRGGRG